MLVLFDHSGRGEVNYGDVYTSAASVTVPLGFSFNYFNETVTSVSINHDGTLYLNSYLVGVYYRNYSSTARLMYRSERNATVLRRLTSRIADSYAGNLPRVFSINNAFVITWYMYGNEVGSNSFQFVMATDTTNVSYIMFIFERLGLTSSQFYRSFYKTAAGYGWVCNWPNILSLSNVNVPGLYMFRVDGGLSFFQIYSSIGFFLASIACI